MTMQKIAVYLAFEQGRAYGRQHTFLGLYDIVDFRDIAFANSLGAQWPMKGDMSNLPDLWRCKIVSDKEQCGIAEQNKIVANVRLLQSLPLDD